MRELDNCSLSGDFRVSHHTEICRFDGFSLEINFKRAHSCNYAIAGLGSSWNENTISDRIPKGFQRTSLADSSNGSWSRADTQKLCPNPVK